jgi:F0F1-type ATP synthase membrane subunit b/b'
MKTLILAAGLFAGLTAASFAEPVRDMRALEEAHHHLQETIREINQARSANHYDMKGHGEKAEKLLHEAERELHEGIEAARHAK